VSIPAHGMALNVTVQSYNGRLDYGLIGCRRAVPDIAELADALLAEHRKLLELARGGEDAAVAAIAPPPKAKPVKAAKAAALAESAEPRRRAVRRGAPLNLVNTRPAGAAAARKPVS